ncbi:hypothetical protein BZU93_26625 [Salmonella enterica subsp. enterica]|nr:hypothetical protein [Escherichia coli]MIL09435.1 hypothetical protein [Salmonella enterica subsp. enterica serovar Enteritidis]
MAEQIFSVDEVTVERKDGKARVKAVGRVNTTGWSDIRLAPSKEHIDPQLVGLDMVGKSPGDALVDDGYHKVEAVMDVDADQKQGVVVYSANDSKRAMF